jgi:hypothetical protein
VEVSVLVNVEPRRFEALSCKDGTILCQSLITVKMPVIVVLTILAGFLSFQKFALGVSGKQPR